MRYYVCNAATRMAIAGPFTREEADACHYDFCARGIPNKGDGTRGMTVKCCVVSEAAFEPNDQGNQYRIPGAKDDPTLTPATVVHAEPTPDFSGKILEGASME